MLALCPVKVSPITRPFCFKAILIVLSCSNFGSGTINAVMPAAWLDADRLVDGRFVPGMAITVGLAGAIVDVSVVVDFGKIIEWLSVRSNESRDYFNRRNEKAAWRGGGEAKGLTLLRKAREPRMALII